MGKTIGEFGIYGQDSGVWAKGILMDEYGFKPEANRWVIGGLECPTASFGFIPHPHPAEVDVTVAPEGKTLNSMLEGLAHQVYCAFSQAKDASADRYRRNRRLFTVQTMVPWMHALIERNVEEFPEDWWPYGISANRAVLDTSAAPTSRACPPDAGGSRTCSPRACSTRKHQGQPASPGELISADVTWWRLCQKVCTKTYLLQNILSR